MTNTHINCFDDSSALMHFALAKQTILDNMPTIQESQEIAIEIAKGRCLAADIISTINVPAYTNSAVDGYALHSRDLPAADSEQNLTIQTTVFAGQFYEQVCQPQHCIRIMTGAAIPAGLDTVIMQEHCTIEADSIRIDSKHQAGQNVRQAGEDIKQGSTVLQAGKLLCPADIGLLASLGMPTIKVKRKLRIAIASTGNEIYSPSATPSKGGLYDSNRYSLMAALDRPDIEITNLGIIKDQESKLLAAFNKAADYADVIISSGGVSVGAADFTKTALQAGGQINFWRIALKPGRPLAFGKIKNCTFFGLPGNPIAVLVTFYQLVLPALEKALAITDKPIAPLMKARSLETIHKKAGRTEIQRGIVSQTATGEWQVKTTGKQGSGILSSMSKANAFIVLEHEQGTINKGDLVNVQLFSGLF